MKVIFATYRQGQVILDNPVDWPNGMRVAVSPLYAEAGAEISGQVPVQVSAGELEKLVDELCDIVDGAGEIPRTPLSDFAVSRGGIYQSHL